MVFLYNITTVTSSTQSSIDEKQQTYKRKNSNKQRLKELTTANKTFLESVGFTVLPAK